MRSLRVDRHDHAAGHGRMRAATRRPRPRWRARRRERGPRSWRAANPDPAYLSCLLLLATGVRRGRVCVRAVRAAPPLDASVVCGEKTAHRIRRASIRSPRAFTGSGSDIRGAIHTTGHELRHGYTTG